MKNQIDTVVEMLILTVEPLTRENYYYNRIREAADSLTNNSSITKQQLVEMIEENITLSRVNALD